MENIYWDKDALNYITQRGFSYLAQDPQRLTDNEIGYNNSQRQIVFYSGGHYAQRTIDPGAGRWVFNRGHDPRAFWNKDALYNDCTYVLVTEGNFDALACICPLADNGVSFNTLCLQSSTNVSALLNEIADNRAGINGKAFYLLLDNDDAGLKASKATAHGLKDLGLRCIDLSPAFYAQFQGCKDPCDAHAQDPQRFATALMSLTATHTLVTEQKAPALARARELGSEIHDDLCTLVFWLLQGEKITNADRAHFFQAYMPLLRASTGNDWHGLFDAMTEYAGMALTPIWDYRSFREYAEQRGVKNTGDLLPQVFENCDHEMADLDFNALVTFQENLKTKIALARLLLSPRDFLNDLTAIETDRDHIISAWDKIQAAQKGYLRDIDRIINMHGGAVDKVRNTPEMIEQTEQWIHDNAIACDNPAIKILLPKDSAFARVLGGGLERGSLNILSGYTGQGKTWLALKWFYDLTEKSGYKGLYFSQEMHIDKLVTRLRVLAAMDGRDPLDLSCADGKQLMKFDLSERAIFETVISQSITERIDFVVLDYIQQSGYGQNQKSYDYLPKLSLELKKLAMDLDIAVIAIAQRTSALSGGPKNKLTEVMDDLGGAKAMSNDADIVFALDNFTTKGLEHLDYVPTQFESENDTIPVAWLVKCRNSKSGQLGTVMRLQWENVEIKAKGETGHVACPLFNDLNITTYKKL